MHSKEENAYFVLVNFGDIQDRNRIIEAHKSLKDCFDRIAGNNEKHKLIFTSPVYSGFVVRTRLPIFAVKDHILGQTWESSFLMEENIRPISTSCLRSGDSLLMFKIGDKFDSQGFSRELAWLQHH